MSHLKMTAAVRVPIFIESAAIYMKPSYPTPHAAGGCSRRDALFLLTATAIAGCKQGESGGDSNQRESRPSDVPIRVLLVGDETAAESISRAWSTIGSTPLAMTTVPVRRTELSTLSAEITDEVATCDLIIYPLILQGVLVRENAIVPESDDAFDGYDSDLGKTAPALRRGACRYGGQFYGISLGSRLPALLSTEDVDSFGSWTEYRKWVQSLNGKAAEPLGRGWAAESFLHRAASTISEGWLFNRENMDARIQEESYVRVLDELLKTSKLYEDIQLSPAEIWEQLRGGKLSGGIGFEVFQAMSDGDGDEQAADTQRDVVVADLPSELASPNILLNPLSPLAAVSSRCRQTSLSKQVMGWLSGGEGSEAIRKSFPSMTISRSGTESQNAQASAYQVWLRERLNSPRTRSGFQIIAGGEYYDAMDQNVLRCLEGKQKPAEALKETAAAWDVITDRVGREKQQTAWRNAEV